jgi:hypothetical protein
MPERNRQRAIGDNDSVVAGGILNQMSTDGHPGRLVGAHPGNTDAAEYGGNWPRLIEPQCRRLTSPSPMSSWRRHTSTTGLVREGGVRAQ